MIHFVNKPMPGKLPKRTSRALLDIEDDAIVPIIRDPSRVADDSDAVFYFPGCGSERLFSQVGLATQAMLYHVGAQCVLPPGYLCCGYPQTAAGRQVEGQKIITDNRVLFHRVANTLNYLDIKTVIVSCGTCMDQLAHYEFEKIFPGCRLLDIHEYLLEKDVQLDGVTGVRYLYHDPCHTPMKTYQPLKVVNALMGSDVALSDRCCGESGTLAVTRPDISTQVRFRKEEEMRKGAAALRADGFAGDVKVLTSCPVVPAGPVALRRRRGHAGRLHRRRNRPPRARRDVDGRLRREGERRRHRARAGLATQKADASRVSSRARRRSSPCPRLPVPSTRGSERARPCSSSGFRRPSTARRTARRAAATV